MIRDRLQQSLKHLGVPVEDYRLLKLLPLIYVAWSDGKMERVQKERIHLFAARELELSAAGAAVLNRWLSERPTHEYIEEGLHDIFFLARAVDDLGVEFTELPELLGYAETIARSTARALDRPEAVSPSAERALAEIASELHIDHGRSWGTLLRELQARRATRRTSGRASRARSGSPRSADQAQKKAASEPDLRRETSPSDPDLSG